MKERVHLDFKCPIDFSSLSQGENGLYCPQCEKTVMDYRGYSKNEILLAFKKRKNETHCAVFPTAAIDNLSPETNKSKSFLTRSGFYLSVLMLLGNIKSLWAQSSVKQQNKEQEQAQIPAGFQKIFLSGTIRDSAGNGIKAARIDVKFLGENLGYATTDYYGNFSCELESYGGIKEVDIKVQADGFYDKSIDSVQILKESPVLQVNLKQNNEKRRDYGYTLGGGIAYVEYRTIGYSRSGLIESSYTGLKFIPQDMWQKPAYTDKLNYGVLIVDVDQAPIPNAKVELRFSSLETRWGLSNTSGNARLHIQLNKPALHAHVVISAEGYHTVRKLFYEFDQNGTETIVLKKKKEPQALLASDTEIQEEPILNSVAVTRDSSERVESNAVAKEHVLVYPNPASEQLSIRLASEKQRTQIRLVDMQGKEILRKTVFNQAFLSLDVKDIAAGNYVLFIQYEGNNFSEKIVIAR